MREIAGTARSRRDVLLNQPPDATERLIAFSETVKRATRAPAQVDAWRQASVEERLKHALLKGVTDHIDKDVEEARQKYGRRWRSSRGR